MGRIINDKKGIVYSIPNAERTGESFDQRENLYYTIRICNAYVSQFHMEENSHILYSKPNAERTEES